MATNRNPYKLVQGPVTIESIAVCISLAILIVIIPALVGEIMFALGMVG